MNSTVQRQTVDLSSYPDLVVVYLGMRVNAWTGIKTLLGLGPQIQDAVGKKARWPPAARGFHDVFVSPAPRHAAVLAGLQRQVTTARPAKGSSRASLRVFRRAIAECWVCASLQPTGQK